MEGFNFNRGQDGGVVHDFFRNTYQPSPIQIQPTEALAQNIEALINPTEVLKQKQLQQAGATIADLKLQDLQGDLYNNQVTAYNNYLQKYQKLLNSNKGINRLRLTPEQQLEIGRDRMNLMQGAKTAMAWQEDYKTATKTAVTLLGEKKITKEDFQKWDKAVTDKFKSALDPNDYSFATRELANIVSGKPNPEKGVYKDMLSWAKYINYSQGGETAGQYDVNKTKKLVANDMRSPEYLTYTRPLAIRNGIINADDTPDQEYQKMVQYAQDYYNPKELGKGTTNINNWGGGTDKVHPAVEKRDGYTYYDFSGNPAKTAAAGGYQGGYITARVAPDGTTEVFLTQIANTAGEPVEINDKIIKIFEDAGAKKDPNKAGGFWMPYTKAAEGVLKRHNIITDEIVGKKYGQYTPPGTSVSGTNTTTTPDWKSQIKGRIDTQTDALDKAVSEKEGDTKDLIHLGVYEIGSPNILWQWDRSTHSWIKDKSKFKVIPKITGTTQTPMTGQTITLQQAKDANKGFRGTDAELIQRYAKQGWTVK